MTLPRLVLPRQTYLITRRCSQRQLLLRPDPVVNQVFRFCLAQAAREHPMLIHCVCVLSNHYHILATDTDRELPQFMEWLNKFVAKCMNVHLGRQENFWAPGSYSAVRLVAEDDVLAKWVYVLTNPTAAGLVASSDAWPGLRCSAGGIGEQRYTVTRPAVFFDRLGVIPAEASLELTRPPRFFRDVDDANRGMLVRKHVATREMEIHASMRVERRSFLGVQTILRQRPTDYPRVRAPHRELNPRVACRDKRKRIELLLLLRLFVQRYREALRDYLGGKRDVEFPFGTYWMWRFFNVRCEIPPTPT